MKKDEITIRIGIENYEELIQQLDNIKCKAEEARAAVSEIKLHGTHARWRQISPAGIYECTNCKNDVMTGDIDVYEYCHRCGARMVESEDKE